MKRLLLPAGVGLASGLSSSLFLYLLNGVTQFRINHPQIIWALPAAGFLIGFLFQKGGKGIEQGNNLVIDQITVPSQKIPLRMAPLILVGTLLTHLFGGSAGREGTAVQMGASLSDALAHFFKVTLKERKYLLLAGAGSGFGSAIGAPWAGVLFGMEMIRVGPFRMIALLECLIASWVAVLTTHFLKAPHTSFSHPALPDFSFKLLAVLFFSGICFGLLSYFFTRVTHFLEIILKKLFSQSTWRAFGGGLVLVLLYSWEGTYRFSGLGISVITQSMNYFSPWQDVVYKFVFTALTLASGFKGGEFIPLVFMGSAFGSFLTPFVGISGLEPSFLASLGFAATFGAASNTPLACTVMAAELFGIQITPYAFLVCLVSYLFSGHQGIYKSQKREETKWQGLLRWLRNAVSWFRGKQE